MVESFTVTEVAKENIVAIKAKKLSDELIDLADIMEDTANKIKNHKLNDLQYTKKSAELKGAANITREWAGFIKKDIRSVSISR